MNKDLKNIITGCIANEQSAQMQLYEMFSMQIYSVCYRILQNSAEAEEVMQDSFLKVFKRMEQYVLVNEKIEFSLRRIAANGSIDLLRKRKNVFISSEDIPDESTMLEADEPEEVGYSLEQMERAIDSLPEGYRLIIVLKLVEQMDNRQIAKQMNITESTVRSQFLRARIKVKEILKNIDV